MAKYNNKKVTIDGITFDSHKEARRYGYLSLLEKAGEITNLARQVEYELIPVQKQTIEYTDKKGKTRHKTIVLERAVKYIADFVYTDKQGQLVVEDVKSDITKTKEYILKRKLMLYLFGIKLSEV
jgi:hypothetical protein